jgi:trehalose/maltose hydrolase-like predicted phosphorylase
MHSLVAARLGQIELSERYFHQTAAIDLNDSMGNSAAGLHMGALGGLWQAAVFGFGGMGLRQDGLAFKPNLPRTWRRLRFPVKWHGRGLAVEVSQDQRLLQVTLERGRPMTIYAGGRAHRIEKGRPVVAPLTSEEEEGK